MGTQCGGKAAATPPPQSAGSNREPCPRRECPRTTFEPCSLPTPLAAGRVCRRSAAAERRQHQPKARQRRHRRQRKRGGVGAAGELESGPRCHAAQQHAQRGQRLAHAKGGGGRVAARVSQLSHQRFGGGLPHALGQPVQDLVPRVGEGVMGGVGWGAADSRPPRRVCARVATQAWHRNFKCAPWSSADH